jgi:hypothetical protein
VSTNFRVPSLFPPVVPPEPRKSRPRRWLLAALSVVGVVGFIGVLGVVGAVTYKYTWPETPTAAPVTTVAPAPTTAAPAVATSSDADDPFVQAVLKSLDPEQMDSVCLLISADGEPKARANFNESFMTRQPDFFYLADRIWAGLLARC